MSAFFQRLVSKIPSSPHLVSQERVCTIDPQANPNIMCLKSSTSQSLTLASTITGSTSKPSSTAARARESRQPDAAALASYGIKVRDFAYESTLPPVKPVHLLPRQIQPGIRSLKRIRDGEVDNASSLPTNGSAERGEGSSSKKSKLERTATEPALQPGLPPTRERGFVNLNDYDPATDSQPIIDSQQSDVTSSQPPPLYFDSQESEPYIDTPFVTPNGSLQWPVTDNSIIPASQLDTESQTSALEPLSYSQLGFSQPDEHSQRQVSRTSSSSSSSSSVLSDPPTSPVAFSPDQLPGPSKITSRHRSPSHLPAMTLRRSLDSSPQSRSARASSTSPTPRYYLRKRATAKAPLLPSKSASRTHRAVLPTVHLTSRRAACSVQSSHSQAKSHNVNGSPRSRTIRTRNAARNTNDGSIIIR